MRARFPATDEWITAGFQGLPGALPFDRPEVQLPGQLKTQGNAPGPTHRREKVYTLRSCIGRNRLAVRFGVAGELQEIFVPDLFQPC